jgi:predicted AAA+ superfamily ATPase
VAQTRFDRPWEEIADQLNETVIQRVLQHDLALDQETDQHLLEEIFRLTCRYAGQAPGAPVFVSEIRSGLNLDVRWQRVLNYLKRLSDSLLLRLTPALELRLKRQPISPKLCLCDHALRAAWLQEIIPLTPASLERSPHLNDLAGHVAESVVGYFLGGIPNLNLAWFPARGAEPEVDFVMTVGENRIPLEVKYRRRVDGHRDTIGLRAFIEKSAYHAPFGILVTLTDDNPVIDPRIVTLPLSSLLLMR